MPDLDLNKISDITQVYQPFKIKKDVEDGCNNQLIIDCKDEIEYIIDLTEKVSIIKDKFKNSYKFKTQKVV